MVKNIKFLRIIIFELQNVEVIILNCYFCLNFQFRKNCKFDCLFKKSEQIYF